MLVLGGAKVADKPGVIGNLLSLVDSDRPVLRLPPGEPAVRAAVMPPPSAVRRET